MYGKHPVCVSQQMNSKYVDLLFAHKDGAWITQLQIGLKIQHLDVIESAPTIHKN